MVEPMNTAVESIDRSDPLANQVSHFAAVIRGEAEPICSAAPRRAEGAAGVVEAVTGAPVQGTASYGLTLLAYAWKRCVLRSVTYVGQNQDSLF